MTVKPAGSIRSLQFGLLACGFRLPMGKTIGAGAFIVLLPLGTSAHRSEIDQFSHFRLDSRNRARLPTGLGIVTDNCADKLSGSAIMPKLESKAESARIQYTVS